MEGYFMKKSNIIIIFLICTVLFIISFGYGYYFIDKRVSEKPNTDNDLVASDDEKGDLEIIKEEERISPNTFIETQTKYTECGHTITNVSQAQDEFINMIESEFREYMKDNYPNTKIVSFSAKKIVLQEVKNYLCPNHYVVGEYQGNIAIFKIDENGERVLEKLFNDYPISLLNDVDQEKLKKGIVVDNEEELSNVLEIFIS